MGIPGVEYFAHPYELNPRIAKEFLFTGDYKLHGRGTVSNMQQHSSISRYVHRQNSRNRAGPDR